MVDKQTRRYLESLMENLFEYFRCEQCGALIRAAAGARENAVLVHWHFDCPKNPRRLSR